MSAKPIAACVAGTRAEAEDLAAACELDYEALPAVHDMLAAPLPGSPLIHEHWSMNAFLETRRDDDVSGLDAIAAAKVTRTLAHRAPVHGADRGQGRAGRMGSAARADDRHHLDPDAARHQDRPGRLPRPRRGPGAHRLARCRRRLRLQGHPAARGDRLRQHRPAARPAGALAGGPLRAAHRRQLPRASLCHHRLGRPRRQASGRRVRGHGRCRRLLRPIPSAPAWKRPRSARSCPAPTCCRCCAATPSRPAPTSRRSCPIAAWRGPACATPWRPRSTRWRASSASRRKRSASPISCRPRRCPTATWWARCSTAAITPSRCAARWRPSISTPSAPARPRARRWASASPPSASRARTAPRSITPGAFPSCRASSRPMCG